MLQMTVSVIKLGISKKETPNSALYLILCKGKTDLQKLVPYYYFNVRE